MFYVYRFIDKQKSVIYVGKSKQDLQQRFAGHLHLPDECYRMVKKIEYIECPTEADMSIKEIYYINKYRNNPVCFNVLDVTDLPTSIEFDDKWKMYKEALPAHFCNSINFKKGYSREKEVRYNKDGTIDKRKTNKEKGVESYVEGLTPNEVNLIVDYFINQINTAENGNQEQIRFRNLVMFVLGVNLPIKTNEFLTLTYGDLFDEKDRPKPYSYKLGRYSKDEVIQIPLRKVVKDVLLAYTTKYGLTYSNDKDEYLFQSRIGHQPVTLNSWWRLLNDAVTSVKIEKNIGAESVRKTYGLNVFQNSSNSLNALVFLGELWGHARESQVIKYLNLTDTEVDFDYYLGETFSLCDVNLSKIDCIRPIRSRGRKVPPEPAKNTLSKIISKKQEDKKKTPKATEKEEKKKKNRAWPKEKKLEVVNKYLSGQGTMKALGEEYGLDGPIVSRWVNAYRQFGESGLEDKRYGKPEEA